MDVGLCLLCAALNNFKLIVFWYRPKCHSAVQRWQTMSQIMICTATAEKI